MTTRPAAHPGARAMAQLEPRPPRVDRAHRAPGAAACPSRRRRRRSSPASVARVDARHRGGRAADPRRRVRDRALADGAPPRAHALAPALHHVGVAGLAAMPIVGLLSLLMGIVVAYQGADQLRRYGANIFVVDLVAVSMLREFAPLVTAIIIAGRSGAAYAAQLGTMAVTEEIDALRVLGISPAELLVLPRISRCSSRCRC